MFDDRTWSRSYLTTCSACLGIVLTLAGCISGPVSTGGAPAAEGLAGPVTHLLVSGRPHGAATGIVGPAAADSRQGYVQLGQEPAGASSGASGDLTDVRDDGRSVTLDFNNSETAVVARVFFEDILREPVVVDAALQGRVTVRTPNPISKPRALNMVREALAVHGAQISRSGGIWRVQARGTGGRAGAREGAQIISLRHLSPEAARSALAGLAGPNVEIQPLPAQNALSVGGTPADVQAIVEAVRSIDVDQMRGMSFGLLPLRVANANAVATELDRIVGRQAGGSQQFQVIPVTRMNALLVIARRPALLAEARRWAARLDQGGAEGRRIFVYPLQNRRAADVAKVLSEILPRTRDDQSSARSSIAASQHAVAPQTVATSDPSRSLAGASSRAAGGASPEFILPSNPEALGPSRQAQRETVDAIRVSADIATNSVVVIARSEDRPTVEAAIRRLDVLPAQVLIEATIAEVRLGDNLRHGVRWYFESRGHSVSLTDSETGSLAPVHPGLNYVFNSLGARVVLRALEQITNVNVISSPALTVLDNQTARLQVGDQVPIATRSSRSVTNPDAPIVNDIEMKDTGVILSVTPRVNASGLVMLDIVQEVSDVVPTTSSGINSPTIRQRRIVSSVAVASGNEVVLGGMIGSSQQVTNEGVPVLQHIPILGNAFRSNAVRTGSKTELLIILRPTVIGNQTDLRVVTDQIRSRMRAGR